MARYINENDLLVQIMDLNLDHVQGDDGRELCQIIQTFPTADVREVVHGQWIRLGTVLECSACHNKIPAPMTKMYPYCPNCGADMRGDA